jgi:hypothetical protein
MAEKTTQELVKELAELKAAVDLMTQEISILKMAVANGGQQVGRRNLPPAEKAKLKAEYMAKVNGK